MPEYQIDNKKYNFEDHISLEEIKNKIYDTSEKRDKELIVAALVNNKIFELNQIPENRANISFITICDVLGNRIYRRSLMFLMACVIYNKFPDCRMSINHTVSNGVYCEIEKRKALNQREINQIVDSMNKLIDRDFPIKKEILSKQKAINIFKEQGFKDKIEVIKQQNKNQYVLYKLNDYYDYLYYNMVPSTKYLKKFKLQYSFPGFVLLFPQRDDPANIPDFRDQPQLGKAMIEYEHFGKIMGISSAHQLNKTIQNNGFVELIQVSEARHEKKIAQIADLIEENIEDKRVILIAGPSSSGKTTFSHRLCIQLKINSIFPAQISLDNYFVNRENTPRDENGELNFEALEALDLELLNNQLIALLQGEKVEIPRYNFQEGKREDKGVFLKLKEDQPLILEGIHCMNNKLTRAIPDEHKFKIYVSALTQINIDKHSRIPTTDTRKIRRIIRDYQFRGHDVLKTLELWPSVRKGEDKNIFPYQENADVMFNSALIYEMPALKKHGLPLLKNIDRESNLSYEAERLIEVLECFADVETKYIPYNSILREFIGNSSFRDNH